jgi:hypothetical protein
LKITILSLIDFAHTGTYISEALRNDFDIKCISLQPHHLYSYSDYNYDIRKIDYVKEVEESDIIYIKDDIPPSIFLMSCEKIGIEFPSTLLSGKKIVVSGEGQIFRRDDEYYDNLSPYMAWHMFPEQMYLSESNRIVVMTPDLKYDWVNCYLPHVYNVRDDINYWNEKNLFKITHSPSARVLKGTDSCLLPAIDVLLQKGIEFDLNLDVNVTNDVCVQHKKETGIFFDQAHLGVYGISLLEASQFGIPCIVNMHKKFINKSNGLLDDCPIISFDGTVDNLVNTIENFINLSTSERYKISNNTKQWTKDYHEILATEMWKTMFNEVSDEHPINLELVQDSIDNIKNNNLYETEINNIFAITGVKQ